MRVPTARRLASPAPVPPSSRGPPPRDPRELPNRPIVYLLPPAAGEASGARPEKNDGATRAPSDRCELERATGFEPATSSLGSLHSTN